MTTLETLFSPIQKEKLRQAALVRTSCRSFAGAPDTAAFAALSYVVGRCALPGARLVLTPVDESLFTGTILGMGRITGCKMAAVVIACGTEALCRVNAGILGEAFVLEATALGLGTCWVSGTYRRKQIRLPMQENETVLAVIAVGVPERSLQAPENRRRKPLDKLMNAVPADGMMLDAAKLVQIAPSAMNNAAVADGGAARSVCADHQRPCAAGRRHCAMPRGTGAARGTSVGVQRGARWNYGGGAGEVCPLTESLGVRVLA